MLDKTNPSTATFNGWLERFGLSDSAAGELLSLSRATIRGYRSGEKTPPQSVLMACAWVATHGHEAGLPDYADKDRRFKLTPWARERGETARGRIAGILSDDEIVITREVVLAAIKQGGTTREIADRLTEKFGDEITTDRVSPHLTRLRADGKVDLLEGGRWQKL